jgi:hypothetical protein
MAKMIFDLTDDDREALERVRIAMGLRSHAETLRALIRGSGGEPAPVAAGRPKPLPTLDAVAKQSFSHGRSKTVIVSPADVIADVKMSVGQIEKLRLPRAPIGSRLKKK